MEEKNEKTGVESKKSGNFQVFFIGCIGILIGVILKLFIIDFMFVSGRSMQPAINDSDKVVVNKLSFGLVKPYSDSLLVQWGTPKVGDIVVYLYNDKNVIKRCVAISGDLLEFSLNSVYNLKVNGYEIPLSEIQYQNLKGSKTVPEGYILAIGDNYEESIDSRNYGFVSTKNILGKVLWK